MAQLETGSPAPDFDAQDHTGKNWSLRELKGERVIVYFYPYDDTPGCTLEACDFRDHFGDFRAAGYTVLGVSNQDETSHRAFADKYELPFPLLIDTDLRITDAYGVRRAERGDYQGRPLDIQRATFVIDEEGTIVEALYGVTAQGHVAGLRESLGV